MLDMGFAPDVKRVIAKLPARRQSLLFSATMPEEIRSIAHRLLREPVSVAVTPVASTKEGDTIYTVVAGGVAYNCVASPDGTVRSFQPQ